MKQAGVLSVATSVFAVVACGESIGGPCADLGAPATLAIGAAPLGSSDPRFAELRDGDDLAVAMSAHGLWQSTLTLRPSGIDLGDEADELREDWPSLTVAITQNGSLLIVPTTLVEADFILRGGSKELAVYYEELGYPLSFIGTPATLDASVTDSCGRTAHRELQVVPVCHPDYAEYCPDGPGGGCLSCRDFGATCRLGCDLDAVLPRVCAGEATTLATAISDCMCAECPADCEMSCSGSGTDMGCGACIEMARGGACAAEASACLRS